MSSYFIRRTAEEQPERLLTVKPNKLTLFEQLSQRWLFLCFVPPAAVVTFYTLKNTTQKVAKVGFLMLVSSFREKVRSTVKHIEDFRLV